MENASKAILIATAVLIAIILLSLMVYIFTRMGSGTAEIYNVMNASEKAEFNQSFLKFETVYREEDGISRNLLTPQDVQTIINLNASNIENDRLGVYITIIDQNEYFYDQEVVYDNINNNNLDEYDVFKNLTHRYTCHVEFGTGGYKEYVRNITIEFKELYRDSDPADTFELPLAM